MRSGDHSKRNSHTIESSTLHYGHGRGLNNPGCGTSIRASFSSGTRGVWPSLLLPPIPPSVLVQPDFSLLSLKVLIVFPWMAPEVCHLNVFVSSVEVLIWLISNLARIMWLPVSSNQPEYFFIQIIIHQLRPTFSSRSFISSSSHLSLHPHDVHPSPLISTPHFHPRNISSHPSDLKSNHVRHGVGDALPFRNLPNIRERSTQNVYSVWKWLTW